MIVTAVELPTNHVQFSPKHALLLPKASRFQLPLLVLFDCDITAENWMRIGCNLSSIQTPTNRLQ
jgi:hypothetical protein